MNNYRKQVELTDTGMVIGEVFITEDGKDVARVGLKFDSTPFRSRKNRFRAVHKWADTLIQDCIQYEARK